MQRNDDDELIGHPSDDAATRRQLLTRAGGVVMVLGGGSLLAACGGGGSAATTPSTTAAPAAGALKQGGTFTLGTNGASSNTHANPFKAYGTQGNVALMNNLYDPLGYPDQTTLAPTLALAEEIVPSKSGRVDSWDVRLREGVEFHDGKTLTADDLIWTTQQRFKKTYLGSPIYAIVDIKRIKKLDDRTVRMPLVTPYADFLTHVSEYDMVVVHSGFDPKKPVGTGPFKFVSGKPGSRWELVANPNFWGPKPNFDKLIIQEFADENARASALKSGQVTALPSVPGPQQRILKAASAVEILDSPTGMSLILTMNTQKAPYDDPRVRQALRLIADRQKMVDQALGGNGVVANDLYSKYDANYNSSLPQRVQDIAKAKALLKEAGHENTEFELVSSPIGAPGIDEASQVYAQQAQDAGINVKYKKLDQAAWVAGYKKWGFSITFYFHRPYLDTAALLGDPKSTYNEANWDDPEWNKLYKQAQAEPDPAKLKSLVQEMQKIDWERGGYIIWANPNNTDAYSTKVTGFKPDKSGAGLNGMRFNQVGFKA